MNTMIYNLIPQKFIDKFYSLLSTKSIIFGKKLYSGKSQKERFVEKVFHKYIGKYYAYLDKRIGYYSFSSGYIMIVNKSYLSGSYQRNYNIPNGATPKFYYVKKYGKLVSVEYVLSQQDIGNHIEVYFESASLDICSPLNFIENSAFDFQFKEIKESEYSAIKNMFVDDREEQEFVVKDYKGEEKIKKAKSFSEASYEENGNWFHCNRPY